MTDKYKLPYSGKAIEESLKEIFNVELSAAHFQSQVMGVSYKLDALSSYVEDVEEENSNIQSTQLSHSSKLLELSATSVNIDTRLKSLSSYNIQLNTKKEELSSYDIILKDRIDDIEQYLSLLEVGYVGSPVTLTDFSEISVIGGVQINPEWGNGVVRYNDDDAGVWGIIRTPNFLPVGSKLKMTVTLSSDDIISGTLFNGPLNSGTVQSISAAGITSNVLANGLYILGNPQGGYPFYYNQNNSGFAISRQNNSSNWGLFYGEYGVDWGWDADNELYIFSLDGSGFVGYGIWGEPWPTFTATYSIPDKGIEVGEFLTGAMEISTFEFEFTPNYEFLEFRFESGVGYIKVDSIHYESIEDIGKLNSTTLELSNIIIDLIRDLNELSSYTHSIDVGVTGPSFYENNMTEFLSVESGDVDIIDNQIVTNGVGPNVVKSIDFLPIGHDIKLSIIGSIEGQNGKNYLEVYNGDILLNYILVSGDFSIDIEFKTQKPNIRIRVLNTLQTSTSTDIISISYEYISPFGVFYSQLQTLSSNFDTRMLTLDQLVESDSTNKDDIDDLSLIITNNSQITNNKLLEISSYVTNLTFDPSNYSITTNFISEFDYVNGPSYFDDNRLLIIPSGEITTLRSGNILPVGHDVIVSINYEAIWGTNSTGPIVVLKNGNTEYILNSEENVLNQNSITFKAETPYVTLLVSRGNNATTPDELTLALLSVTPLGKIFSTYTKVNTISADLDATEAIVETLQLNFNSLLELTEYESLNDIVYINTNIRTLSSDLLDLTEVVDALELSVPDVDLSELYELSSYTKGINTRVNTISASFLNLSSLVASISASLALGTNIAASTVVSKYTELVEHYNISNIGDAELDNSVYQYSPSNITALIKEYSLSGVGGDFPEINNLSAYQDLSPLQLVYLRSDYSSWDLANSTSEETCDGLIGFVVSTVSTGNNAKVRLGSTITYPNLIVGETYYVGETDGEITNIPPSTIGSVVRVVGYAESTSILRISPDISWVVVGDGSIQTTNIEIAGHAYADSEVNVGNGGTNTTVTWTSGNFQKILLTDPYCTITFISPNGPATLILKVIQDGTGGRNVIWPDSVKWTDGNSPQLSTNGNAIDIVSLYYDGTAYYAGILNNLM